MKVLITISKQTPTGDLMGRLLPVIFWLCLASVSPVRAEAVTGAGSTFAFPLLGQWGQKFQAFEESGNLAAVSPDGPITSEGGLGSLLSPWATGIDYEPVGSLGGIMRVIGRAVDFGASERPLSAGEVDHHGLIQFPITTGGIAVVFNLPGIADATLRLTGAVLADIYLGRVDTWSHPDLKALNPDVPCRMRRSMPFTGATGPAPPTISRPISPSPATTGRNRSASIPN